MAMPTMSTSSSVSPPSLEGNPPPSLSPIMQPPIAPPSLNEINPNQVDLDQLQRLQNEQDSKISELGNLLGPLSPSGHVPDLGDGEAYFDPQPVDPNQYFDTNAFLGNGHFGAHENNSNFTLDTDPNSHNHNSSLHTGKMIPTEVLPIFRILRERKKFLAIT
jgi:heat shock transcription factor